MASSEGTPAGAWAPPAYDSSSSASGTFGELPPRPRAWSERMRRLAAWTGVGLLLMASVVLFPVGLLTLPVALAAGAYMATRRPAWPEVVGLLPGAAVFTAYVAYRNRHHQPCGTAFTGVVTSGGEVSCAGIAPQPWVAATVLLLVLAVVGYAVAVAVEQRRVR